MPGKRAFIALVTSVALSLAVESLAISAATDAAALNNYLREQAQTGRFTGAIGIARGEGVLFQQGFGLANMETREPNAADTKFNLASLGKLFTRIAILQLAQAGAVDMDAKVGRYIPDYPNKEVREKVTIRQLYDMRSGVGSYWNAKFFKERTRLRSIDDYIALFADEPLLFEPGTKTSYSNGGYIILGKVIEATSGLSYDDYVQRHIGGPAGLTDTGHFAIDQRVAKLATGYTSAAAGRHMAASAATSAASVSQPLRVMHGGMAPASPAAIRPNIDELPGRGLSAGGGYSSVRDLLKLATAIRGNKLLNPTYTAQLLGRNYQSGTGYMAIAGGFPGTSTQFTMFPDGTTLVVLSNRDMPVASMMSQQLARILGKEFKPVGPTIVAKPRPAR